MGGLGRVPVARGTVCQVPKKQGSRAEVLCRAQAVLLGHQCSELCTGSARTEPAEPCLAGHGLKLSLGGLANELMAIN